VVTEWDKVVSKERCFIVGTGPSLRETKGLGLLDCEDTFGVNQLDLWEDLPFTPTYYAGNLTEVVCGYTPIDPRCLKQKFVFYNPRDDVTVFPEGWIPVPKRMRFTQYDDEMVGLGVTLPRIPGGGTITLTLVQWALWMGYREVYLLGVDQHNGGKVLVNKDHQQSLGIAINLIRWQAWEWLREYCEDNGVIIKDCTPGGALTERKILEYQDLCAL